MYRRIANIGFGVVLVLAGMGMLVLPGPGLLAIAAGTALMLSQWPAGRRMLARIRLRMRQRYGSSRVKRIEARIPDGVCPTADTIELRALVAGPLPPAPVPPSAVPPAAVPPVPAPPTSAMPEPR